MRENKIEGRIYFCGDFVNTDVMAPGRFDPIYEPSKLAKIALVDYKGMEPLVGASGPGRFPVIVAGEDFGCGSSRETAPLALAAAGVKVIIARSFARIFFRNCVNLGEILPIAIPHSFGEHVHGALARIDLNQGKLSIADESFTYSDLGEVQEIFDRGGLSQYIREKGGF